MNSKFVRFFVLLLTVCFCCCVVVQPMTVEASFDKFMAASPAIPDKFLDSVETLLLYYYPFVEFTDYNTGMFYFYNFFSSYLDNLSLSPDELSEYLISLRSSVSVEDIGFSVDSVALDFCNNFSVYLTEVFSSNGLSVGSSYSLGDSEIIYKSDFPVYDYDSLFSSTKVFVDLTNYSDGVVNHVLVSPVSDSLDSFLVSIGDAALISISVGVVLFACYALIRLIRRIL